MPIGIPELLIVLAIVLLILGPKRLPALGRSLGGGIRNFKDSIARRHEEGELEAGKAPEDTEPLTGEVVPDRRP
jgi:sec-independent protein translocase protein TatA